MPGGRQRSFLVAKQNTCCGGWAHHANRMGVITSLLLVFSEAPWLLGPFSYNSIYYMTDLWSQGSFFFPNRFIEKHLKVHCYTQNAKLSWSLKQLS